MKQFLIIILLSYNLLASSYPSLLFSGNCETCHKIGENISAPSINLIRKKYKEAFSNKEEFVKYMSEWVYSPNEQGSLMLDQVNKYGLMPHLSYDKKTLEEISSYIFDTEF